MKKLLALTIVFCLLTTPATPVIAQTHPGPGTPLLFNSQPDLTWQKIEGGSILVITADSNTYYILNTEKKPFPPGTESGKKLRPDNKWETYTQLPGQTNWQIVTTDMVISQSVQEPLSLGIIPQGMGQKAEPHSIITGFPTGYATITPAIEKQLEPLAKDCKEKDVFCIIEGQASRLGYSACYVDIEAGYIAPPSGHKTADYPNAKLIKGDRNCNEHLGKIRAMNVAGKLVQMGAPKERVFWLTHASWGIRDGTNYENQAVVAFVLARTKIVVESGRSVIGSDMPVECPTCPPTEPPIINIQGDCVVANRQNNNGRWEVTVICFHETTPPSQSSKAEDECWKWAIGGGLVGGGLGYGVSELDIQGGQGGGNAGDGGSVSICGDNPAACILGGMVGGAGAAYLYCKTKQWIKKSKEEKK